ncbi:Eco57I restriction-modification methylase domain-containing protein [Paenibacillus sp.]|uniref:Eco57I restriction-modification methylase domain-containing protein n=1 Tax=Paenibacillus sp. TaxID=58172 RepID=UPI0028A8F661|nr:Eco57I restriction-modification methylase domain-containing protein [Paenibacillus sp.]
MKKVLEEYIDDFIISCIGTLFNFYQIVGSETNFTLYADSAREQPIGTLFTLHYSDDVSSETKGRNFGYSAVQLARKEKLRWSFLTNGLIWRIYDVNSLSPYETYLEMNLADVLFSKSEIDEDAKLFSLFCQAKSYYSDSVEVKSQIETYFENSEKEMEKLESVLKGKIEKVVTDISYGFIQSIGKEQYSDGERRKIFEDSIILLYRMLFIQYAESRALFPMDNETYVKQSFESLAQSAKEFYHSGNLANYNDSYVLWRQLDLLRGYINSGWDDIDMKAYNGGLFDNEHHDILNSYSISDTFFAEVLCGLSFIKDKNGSFTDRIEYKDLSVRSLGGLYEGLLEFNLFIAEEELVRRTAKGKVTYIPTIETTVKQTERNSIISKGEIYLSQDALERKDTGSYYTPEDVVNYIIENTVGKKLKEIRIQFTRLLESEESRLLTAINSTEKQAIYNSIDQKVNEFIQKNILTLSVLDNSMGSGHFLVNTAHYIANFIMEIVHSSEWESDYLKGELSYWKIQVVSHCIFGIDINPLALHLGKLSLWLVSAAKNKPLSFMDHHLKVGNSLIGIDKRQVEKQINDWTDGEYDIFTASYNSIIENVLNKYSKISQMPEETRDQVHAKKDLYDEINSEVELLKKKFDVYLGMIQIDGKVNEESFLKLLNFSESELDYSIDEYEEYLIDAQKFKYFHWDLEFPDIMENGGFDIVIGNPPYVVVTDTKPYKQSIIRTLQTNNLFSYMMERAIKHSKSEGYFGVIVPISSVAGETMIPLQKCLLTSLNKLYISNYSTRPSKLFQKVEQRLSIIMGVKDKNTDKVESDIELYTTSYLKWYSHERKKLFTEMLQYSRCYKENIMDGIIPKIGNHLENDIFRKIKSVSNKLESLTDKDGELYLYYHGTPRYWNKAMDYVPGFYSEKQGHKQSTEYKTLSFNDESKKNVFGCVVNSALFYWWWNVVSDCRHLTKRDVMDFNFNWEGLSEKMVNKLDSVFIELMENFKTNKKQIIMNLGGNLGQVTLDSVEHQLSKPIIDKIDGYLAEYYGFNDEELSFIRNYDYRFRMGEEGVEHE